MKYVLGSTVPGVCDSAFLESEGKVTFLSQQGHWKLQPTELRPETLPTLSESLFGAEFSLAQDLDGTPETFRTFLVSQRNPQDYLSRLFFAAKEKNVN